MGTICTTPSTAQAGADQSRGFIIKSSRSKANCEVIGASLSEPHRYVANRGKRNALWCVRTRNFSTVIKIPSACGRNFYQFVVNLPIVFPSSQLLRQFAWLRISQDSSHFARRFTFRKTLHISQDVICWQSWSNNNSKYGLVRRTYTIHYGRTRCFRARWRICFWQ